MSGRELFKPYEVKNSSSYSKDSRKIRRVEKEVGSEILHPIPSESGLHIFKVTGSVETQLGSDRWISGLYFSVGSFLYLRLSEYVAARSPKEARLVMKKYLEWMEVSSEWKGCRIESLNVTLTKKRTTKAALRTYLPKAIIHKSAEACFAGIDAVDDFEEQEKGSKGMQMNLL